MRNYGKQTYANLTMCETQLSMANFQKTLDCLHFKSVQYMF